MLFFSWLSGDQFLVWGWRIPFFLSIVMVGVGLWIRLGILETPVFQKIVEEERIERVPVLEVLKRQPKQVLLTRAAADAGAGARLYRRRLHLHLWHDGARAVARLPADRRHRRRPSSGSSGSPCAGHLSDVIGRKNMYMIGCVFMGIFGFVYFAMLNTMNPTVIFIAIAISLLPVMTLYGPEAALIAESVLAAAALQRRLARLSACLDHRRRSVAVHRDVAVRRPIIRACRSRSTSWSARSSASSRPRC